MLAGLREIKTSIAAQLISLIICARTKAISPALQANIDATIGVGYELVVIDNSANRYSIFEAYNIGVSKSTFPYLCFMHDDIEYHTQNWGQKTLGYFEDEKTGAIGMAGSPYAPAMPGSWWGNGLVNEYILPVSDSNAGPRIKTTGTAGRFSEVVTLDGIWMCIRKSIFSKIAFDEKNYRGFHFYDVDIAIQINRLGYKLYCAFDVLISHYSVGNMNQNWIDNALVFNTKWRGDLPISCIPLTYAQKCEAELKTLQEFINTMLYNNYNPKTAYRFAVLQLLKFGRGYFYYKTPGYILKYLGKSFK